MRPSQHYDDKVRSRAHDDEALKIRSQQRQKALLARQAARSNESASTDFAQLLRVADGLLPIRGRAVSDRKGLATHEERLDWEPDALPGDLHPSADYARKLAQRDFSDDGLALRAELIEKAAERRCHMHEPLDAEDSCSLEEIAQTLERNLQQEEQGENVNASEQVPESCIPRLEPLEEACRQPDLWPIAQTLQRNLQQEEQAEDGNATEPLPESCSPRLEPLEEACRQPDLWPIAQTLEQNLQQEEQGEDGNATEPLPESCSPRPQPLEEACRQPNLWPSLEEVIAANRENQCCVEHLRPHPDEIFDRLYEEAQWIYTSSEAPRTIFLSELFPLPVPSTQGCCGGLPPFPGSGIQHSCENQIESQHLGAYHPHLTFEEALRWGEQTTASLRVPCVEEHQQEMIDVAPRGANVHARQPLPAVGRVPLPVGRVHNKKRHSASGQGASGQSASGQSTSGQSASGQSASGQSASGQSASGQPVPVGRVPVGRVHPSGDDWAQVILAINSQNALCSHTDESRIYADSISPAMGGSTIAGSAAHNNLHHKPRVVLGSNSRGGSRRKCDSGKASREPLDQTSSALWHIIEQILRRRPELEAGKKVTVPVSEWLPGVWERCDVNRALRSTSRRLPGLAWSLDSDMSEIQVHLADIARFSSACDGL